MWRIADFQFIPGAIQALQQIRELGYALVVVTNQSGIGRGYYTEADYLTLTRWMLATLAEQGIVLDGVYHCPHRPEAGCECRKPAPGMLLQAARELGLDLPRSWAVGDKPTDIQAAARAGLTRTVLVRSGQPLDPAAAKALFVCDSILDMIPLLRKGSASRRRPAGPSRWNSVKYTDVDLNGKTVLVTGGAGFIGSHLALHLQEEYPACRVVVFDAFVLGHFRNLRGFRGQCLAGDLANPEDLRQLAAFRFDYIFHQAAISDTTVADQKRMVQVNTNAFRALLDLAESMSAGVVYASSAAVYGNSPAPNCVGAGEEPENVYGFSKLMMDHVAYDYLRGGRIPIVGLRYFNVYGPRESAKGRMASMVLQLGRQLLSGRRPRLFKHGEQRRDFIYVEDVVQANLRAVQPRQSGVYNVGTGQARQFNELLEILQSELGTSAEVEYIDNPWSFYQSHTAADITATRAALGYAPRYNLEAGVAHYADEIRRRASEI